MNIHNTISGLLLSVLLFITIVAAGKADFSGLWIMDKSKSEGLPPDMEQRMRVTQDGDRIEIETDLFQGDNVNTVPDRYNLDGKEVETPLRLNSGEQTNGKRTTKWSDEGRGFEVRDAAVFDMPNGKVTIMTVRKWALAADGKSLVIEINRTGPDGVVSSKRTFNRK